MLRKAVIALALLPALAAAQGGMAQSVVGSNAVATNPDLKGVYLEGRIGESIPTDVTLKDDHGQPTNPGRLLRGRPLVVLPIFYLCNGVCTTEMQGVLSALRRNPKLRPGRDLDVVVLGLNPKETPELAAAKKEEYLDAYGHRETKDGWTFLTGPQKEVARVANALGVHYVYHPGTDRVDHPSAVAVLTPEGRVSTVMTEGMYPSARFAEDVARAAKEELGPKETTSWFGCVHTDAVTGKRSIAVQSVTRAVAVAVVLVLLGSMVLLSRRRTAS